MVLSPSLIVDWGLYRHRTKFADAKLVNKNYTMQQETHLAICSHWPFAIVPIETCTKSAHLKIYTCNGYSPTRHANHSVHVVIGWTAHLPLSQSTVFTVTASCIHRCTVTVGIQKWCVHRDKYTMQTNYTNACYITNTLPALCNN